MNADEVAAAIRWCEQAAEQCRDWQRIDDVQLLARIDDHLAALRETQRRLIRLLLNATVL